MLLFHGRARHDVLPNPPFLQLCISRILTTFSNLHAHKNSNLSTSAALCNPDLVACRCSSNLLTFCSTSHHQYKGALSTAPPPPKSGMIKNNHSSCCKSSLPNSGHVRCYARSMSITSTPHSTISWYADQIRSCSTGWTVAWSARASEQAQAVRPAGDGERQNRQRRRLLRLLPAAVQGTPLCCSGSSARLRPAPGKAGTLAAAARCA